MHYLKHARAGVFCHLQVCSTRILDMFSNSLIHETKEKTAGALF